MVGQEDDFMKQCMDTCKEQIEKLAKDPELLSQTLEPFMRISQKLVTGGMLDGPIPGMISDSSNMGVDALIRKNIEIVGYIKSNRAQFMKESDVKLKQFYKSIKDLRKLTIEILIERGIIKKTES